MLEAAWQRRTDRYEKCVMCDVGDGQLAYHKTLSWCYGVTDRSSATVAFACSKCMLLSRPPPSLLPCLPYPSRRAGYFVERPSSTSTEPDKQHITTEFYCANNGGQHAVDAGNPVACHSVAPS